MTGPEPDWLAPLPIRVRPRLGESTASYVRRLARANHLKPSFLHETLCSTTSPTASVRPARLAALTGRSTADLARALPDLLPPAPAATRRQPGLRRPQSTPSAHSAKADELMLFSAIRADAASGCPVRLLAARHRVVRQALTGVTPQRRQVVARYTRVLDHTREHIDALLPQALTARQIWCQILDDHDIAISFASVRGYIARQRKTATT